MPKVGEEEFAYTPEGMAEAKLKADETGIPMTNAPDRVEKYQIGGEIKPTIYEKGGKVK